MEETISFNTCKISSSVWKFANAVNGSEEFSTLVPAVVVVLVVFVVVVFNPVVLSKSKGGRWLNSCGNQQRSLSPNRRRSDPSGGGAEELDSLSAWEFDDGVGVVHGCT